MAKTQKKTEEKTPSFSPDELKTEIRTSLKELDDKKLFAVAKKNGVDVKKYADLPRANQRMNTINSCIGCVGRMIKEGTSKRAIVEAFKA